MKKLYTLSFLLWLFCANAFGQYLVSSELVFSWTAAQLGTQGVFGAQNGVTMLKIIYNTTDPQGEPTIASGAIFIPIVNNCSFPIGVYCHGTIYLKEDVPSRNNGEALVGKYLGAFGYIGVLPDYLGLGDSPGLHPYMHAATEASATIDLMRATLEYCAENGIEFNDQVFLTGYSQGGHAAVATLKEIETNLSEEFNVVACAGGSGPYDMSGIQGSTVAEDIPYESPEYLPYIIFSYQLVYGNLFNAPADFLMTPYDETLPPLFDGLTPGGMIAAAMPNIPNQIIVPAELEAFNTDPNHPMKLALQDNDLYDWAPQTPLRLYYCTGDLQVFHENALFAQTTMESNGAADVTAINMGTGNHGACAAPTLFDALAWFDTLKQVCSVSVVELEQTRILMFPNPASNQVQLQFAEYGIWNLKVLDITGKTVLQHQFSGTYIDLNLSSIQSGIYVITVNELPGKQARLVVQK
jgi:hypothetical protein